MFRSNVIQRDTNPICSTKTNLRKQQQQNTDQDQE